MTRIVSDAPHLPGEQQTTASVDQARRFAWRLQWEKAQLEHNQAQRQSELPDSGTGKISTQPPEMHDRVLDRAWDQSGLPGEEPLGDEVWHSPQSSGSPQQQAGMDRLVQPTQELQAHSSVAAAQNNEGARRDASPIQRAAQAPRPQPSPASRQSAYPSAHVYQSDGEVEVALRNAGLSGNDGVKLLIGLQRDLATHGLKLARLTLNGEMFWPSEPDAQPSGLRAGTDDAPIDKIY